MFWVQGPDQSPPKLKGTSKGQTSGTDWSQPRGIFLLALLADNVRLDIVVEHLARLWVQMLLPLIVQLLLERRIITGNHRNAL